MLMSCWAHALTDYIILALSMPQRSCALNLSQNIINIPWRTFSHLLPLPDLRGLPLWPELRSDEGFAASPHTPHSHLHPGPLSHLLHHVPLCRHLPGHQGTGHRATRGGCIQRIQGGSTLHYKLLTLCRTFSWSGYMFRRKPLVLSIWTFLMIQSLLSSIHLPQCFLGVNWITQQILHC